MTENLFSPEIIAFFLPLAFYMFSSVLVISATLAISARNQVHSVLWLILSFFNMAGLFLLLGAEFLAMMLIIVYVGAVAVLFLFVVMMLNLEAGQARSHFLHNLPAGLLVGGLFLAELVVLIMGWEHAGRARSLREFPVQAHIDSNTEALGAILYTDYALPFQMAGLILLTAMIGAITLTLRHRDDIRRQNIDAQLAQTPENLVEMVHVPIGSGV